MIDRRQQTGSATRTPAKRPFDAKSFFARRTRLILICSAILFGFNFPVQLYLSRPEFAAEGSFIIDPSRQYLLSGAERDNVPGNAGDYVRTLAIRVKDWTVLDTALQRIKPEDLPEFLEGTRNHSSQLIALALKLSATEIPRTFLLNVRITGTKPHGLAPTLDTIMESFLDILNKEKEVRVQLRNKYLLDERRDVTDRLARLQSQIDSGGESQRRKLYVEDGYTSHLSNIDWTQRLYVQTYASLAQEEGLVQKAEAQLREFQKLSIKPLAEGKVQDLVAITRLEQWTLEQVNQLKQSIEGYAENNPSKKLVLERIQSMENFLDSYRTTAGENALKILMDSRTSELQAEVIRSRTTLDAYRIELQRMAQMRDSAVEQAEVVAAAIANSRVDFQTVQQLRNRIEALDSRIDDLAMESKSPLPVSITRHPIPPSRPVKSRGILALPISLALSFLPILLLVYIFDRFDRRIRSQFDIEAAIGGNCPDPIPKLEGKTLPSGILDDEGNPAAMAVRELAARINMEREMHGSKIFVFGGCGKGVGTSSLTWLTALALSESGYKTAVFEMNIDRPGLRNLYGLKNSRSSVDFLSRQHPELPPALAGVTEAFLAPTVVAKEHHDLSGLAELLQEARHVYDAFFIDAGDFVGDDRSKFALIHADTVIIVAQEDASAYKDLQTILGNLARVAVKAYTAVLTMSSNSSGPREMKDFERLWSHVTRLHRRVVGVLRRKNKEIQ